MIRYYLIIIKTLVISCSNNQNSLKDINEETALIYEPDLNYMKNRL